MITNGWVDWATRRPGPANKVFDATNQIAGFVCHSVEGWLNGAFGELDKPSRQASWHFTNGLDGTLYQHYPLTASCWASGNFEANTRFVAMELEGLADMPINDDQLRTTLRLFADLEAWGLKLTRGTSEADRTLWMHREVATRWFPNAGPTGCPSDRYARLFEVMEDDMTPEDRAKLDAVYDALVGRGDAEGAKRIAAWNEGGNSLLLGYTQYQERVGKLEAGGPAGGIPEHTHEIGGVKA